LEARGPDGLIPQGKAAGVLGQASDSRVLLDDYHVIWKGYLPDAQNVLVDASKDKIYLSLGSAVNIYDLSAVLGEPASLASVDNIPGFSEGALIEAKPLGATVFDLVRGKDNYVYVGYGPSLGMIDRESRAFTCIGELPSENQVTHDACRLAVGKDPLNRNVYVGATDGHMYVYFRDCDYILGDINGNGVVNGVDVVYGTSYFKGGPPPPDNCALPEGPCPQGNPFYAAGDVNGSCSFNGVDITYLTAYFKGGPGLICCPGCHPDSQ
jgi:hypothetical protein